MFFNTASILGKNYYLYCLSIPVEHRFRFFYAYAVYFYKFYTYKVQGSACRIAYGVIFVCLACQIALMFVEHLYNCSSLLIISCRTHSKMALVKIVSFNNIAHCVCTYSGNSVPDYCLNRPFVGIM